MRTHWLQGQNVVNKEKGALLVGQSFRGAQALAGWLERCGFRCHFADNMREASDLLPSRPVDLALSDAHLSDGSGLRLLDAEATGGRRCLCP